MSNAFKDKRIAQAADLMQKNIMKGLRIDVPGRRQSQNLPARWRDAEKIKVQFVKDQVL